jgi:hypothetical protein
VEHTTTANGMANGIRQGYTGGLVLSQLHIGLAVGFTLVACLTAFGGGVIVGMWYKASEQSAPLSAVVPAPMAEQPTQSQEPVSQPPEPQASVTFYKTLTNSSGAYAPLTLAPTPATNGASGSTKGAAAAASAPAAGMTSAAKTAASGATPARGMPTGEAADSPKAATATPATAVVVPTTKTPPGATRTAAVREPQKHTKAAPAAKAAPVEAAAATTAAQKPVAPARQVGKDIGVQRPASTQAVAPAKATSAEDFSVQVGSFGSSEQAERLRTSLAQKGYPARVQLSAVPGQGLRYRVRVGRYTERTAADQTAHHLTAQEQVPAIVAGKD